MPAKNGVSLGGFRAVVVCAVIGAFASAGLGQSSAVAEVSPTGNARPAEQGASSHAHEAAENILFAQNGASMTYDDSTKMLTLRGMGPSVIFFADRPYRAVGHVRNASFVQLWNEGADSFEQDPPNAAVSVLHGDDKVTTAVVELSEPRIVGDRMSYRVVRVLQGELPAVGDECSLFIDGLLDPGGLRGGLLGAGAGAIVGSFTGDAGAGAAIGAGVGLVGGAIRKDLIDQNQQKEAEQAAATTRVVNVPNPNGSFTPVTLHLGPSGWVGPKGEVYPTLPTPEQLEPVYGVR